jgi:hypothetical protein
MKLVFTLVFRYLLLLLLLSHEFHLLPFPNLFSSSQVFDIIRLQTLWIFSLISLNKSCFNVQTCLVFMTILYCKSHTHTHTRTIDLPNINENIWLVDKCVPIEKKKHAHRRSLSVTISFCSIQCCRWLKSDSILRSNMKFQVDGIISLLLRSSSIGTAWVKSYVRRTVTFTTSDEYVSTNANEWRRTCARRYVVFNRRTSTERTTRNSRLYFDSVDNDSFYSNWIERTSNVIASMDSKSRLYRLSHDRSSYSFTLR